MSQDDTVTNMLGLGTAPLGNMFRAVPDDEAQRTLAEAWELGIRRFDTAPQYGAGLSDLRLGEALADKDRSEYLLSTKVGRHVLDETEEKQGLYRDGRKNKVILDFSESAALRSIEQSLQRLRTDRLDHVYVHDISPDYFGDEWITRFDEARRGAFRALTRLREEGVISSWGVAVNTTEPIEIAMELTDSDPDMCLSATQYTLLQHERALQRMMPTAVEKGVGIVVGSPFNSGALLGGSHFDYAEAPAHIRQRVAQFSEIADRYDVSLKAAALQFSTAHPAVAAVIPGSTRPERIAEDVAALQATIPSDFWQELLGAGLIAPNAPLPTV